MLDDAIRAELAADLAEAERSRVPIHPLTDGNPGIDVVDAYEIQLLNIRQRVAEGARVVGHKVGLSSEAMQKMMNVDEPDYGHLLADMEVFQDVPVKTSDYLYPRVEVEVGFVLADDLPGAVGDSEAGVRRDNPLVVVEQRRYETVLGTVMDGTQCAQRDGERCDRAVFPDASRRATTTARASARRACRFGRTRPTAGSW